MAIDDSDMLGESSSRPPPIPSQPPPLPKASGVAPRDPQTEAREKFQLAMTQLRLAHQYPTSPFERSAMELLAQAMELDPKFLDAPLMLGLIFFERDPVKHAKAIVECATRAHFIDIDHREALIFLADVLEIPECRQHFLELARGSYEPDEIDDFIAGLRYDAEG